MRIETEVTLVLFSPVSVKETYWRVENSFFAKPLDSSNAGLGWGGRGKFAHLRSSLDYGQKVLGSNLDSTPD